MKHIYIILTIAFIASAGLISCAKKPLTLDEQTSMKTLLKANDKEITDLVLKEISEETELNAEDVNVDYILRDEENKAIAVKIKINKDEY